MTKKYNATLYFAEGERATSRWRVVGDNGASRWGLNYYRVREPLSFHSVPCWDEKQKSKSRTEAYKKMMKYSKQRKVDVVCLGRVHWEDFCD